MPLYASMQDGSAMSFDFKEFLTSLTKKLRPRLCSGLLKKVSDGVSAAQSERHKPSFKSWGRMSQYRAARHMKGWVEVQPFVSLEERDILMLVHVRLNWRQMA